MSDDEIKLDILSNEELEASLSPGEPLLADAATEPAEEEYDGPEKRSGKQRRIALDRRDMIRFEPEREKPDRRCGHDRRKEHQKPEDLWHFRDF